MKIVVATRESNLLGQVAPQFESAPYFLIVDTHSGRAVIFPNPVQYQAVCSPNGLVSRLYRFGPEAIIAGSFSAEVHKAALAHRILLQQALGPAGDAVDQYTNGSPLSRRDHCAVARTSST
jgi:predicted Fe-Mo cluster-binding NifX family protein